MLKTSHFLLKHEDLESRLPRTYLFYSITLQRSTSKTYDYN